MAKATASDIAATVLMLCKHRGIEVSNLKLQKLTYYAEAWHLALEGVSLYEDPIEAWVHGPVIPKVFREYRGYRWSPIVEAVGTPSKDQEILEHIGSVLDAYGNFSATQLERLTHTERPWVEARKGYAPDESSSEPIDREVMREYYSTLIGQQ